MANHQFQIFNQTKTLGQSHYMTVTYCMGRMLFNSDIRKPVVLFKNDYNKTLIKKRKEMEKVAYFSITERKSAPH